MPDPECYGIREVKSIVEDDQTQWGSDFQGILIDADWDTLQFSELVTII